MGTWTAASFIGVDADVNDRRRKSVPMSGSLCQNPQSQSIFRSQPGKPDRSEPRSSARLTIFKLRPPASGATDLQIPCEDPIGPLHFARDSPLPAGLNAVTIRILRTFKDGFYDGLE